jgi:hypothetical protein
LLCAPRTYYTGKEKFPTVAYEVTVDHSGRVLGATRGLNFAGAKNDKTIVRFDLTVSRVRIDLVYTEQDLEFKLLDANGEEMSERGAYLIVDGGYHKVCHWCPKFNTTDIHAPLAIV